MSYSDLFDGEEHWLGLDEEEGWTKPDLRVKATVQNEVQGKLTPQESPTTNIVPDVDRIAAMTWGVEDGWQGFAVMIQQIGALLSPGGENQLVAEQFVVRDERTFKVKSKHYKVLWKGSQDDVEGI